MVPYPTVGFLVFVFIFVFVFLAFSNERTNEGLEFGLETEFLLSFRSFSALFLFFLKNIIQGKLPTQPPPLSRTITNLQRWD